MRIESVRYDASGDATIVASGGIIFLIPLNRIQEFAASAAERLGLPMDTEKPKAVEALVDRLIAAETEFDPEDSFIQNLSRVDQEWKAEKKGFELCARAEQSSQGLRAKLIARGFSPVVAAAAVQRLIEVGAVDDVRFASIWARTRAERKCEGPSLVAASLRAKGLGQEAVRKALSSVDFNALIPRAIEKEIKRLSRHRAEKGDHEEWTLREEIYRSLKAQGFDASVVREELGS